jgi:hypothetical protein
VIADPLLLVLAMILVLKEFLNCLLKSVEKRSGDAYPQLASGMFLYFPQSGAGTGSLK